MRGGPKGAKRPLERPLDGRVRPRRGLARGSPHAHDELAHDGQREKRDALFSSLLHTVPSPRLLNSVEDLGILLRSWAPLACEARPRWRTENCATAVVFSVSGTFARNAPRLERTTTWTSAFVPRFNASWRTQRPCSHATRWRTRNDAWTACDRARQLNSRPWFGMAVRCEA